MRLTIGRVLDRGWSAEWVMNQPIYRLSEMLWLMAKDDQERLRNQPSRSGEGGSKTYQLSPQAMAQLKAKREAQRAELSANK